ncbi:helix-turn-helix transcriptional regulator [Lachnospiraceae bacterium 46-61]
MDTLGERLNYARKKNGYTQESLGDTIGVSRGVIFNLEKNKTEPQTIVINAICQTLKINKDWLLTGHGDMEDTNEAAKSAKILAELYEVAQTLSEKEQLYLLDTVKSLKQLLNEKNKNTP